MKTLYKTVALLLITPLLIGMAVFGASLFLMLAVVGALYDAPTMGDQK